MVLIPQPIKHRKGEFFRPHVGRGYFFTFRGGGRGLLAQKTTPRGHHTEEVVLAIHALTAIYPYTQARRLTYAPSTFGGVGGVQEKRAPALE